MHTTALPHFQMTHHRRHIAWHVVAISTHLLSRLICLGACLTVIAGASLLDLIKACEAVWPSLSVSFFHSLDLPSADLTATLAASLLLIGHQVLPFHTVATWGCHNAISTVAWSEVSSLVVPCGHSVASNECSHLTSNDFIYTGQSLVLCLL